MGGDLGYSGICNTHKDSDTTCDENEAAVESHAIQCDGASVGDECHMDTSELDHTSQEDDHSESGINTDDIVGYSGTCQVHEDGMMVCDHTEEDGQIIVDPNAGTTAEDLPEAYTSGELQQNDDGQFYIVPTDTSGTTALTVILVLLALGFL